LSKEEKVKSYMHVLTVQTIKGIQKTHVHGLCTTKDYYATVAEEGVTEGAAKQRLKVVFDEGYVTRVLRGAYSVTLEGHELLESVGIGEEK
jgi:predicted transcriptional regulator